MRNYDLVIVGGGASGLLCAINAKKEGIENILIIEKDAQLGGALNTANYNISSTHKVTGQAYKEDLLKKFITFSIDIQLNTMVLNIDNDRNIICMSPNNGLEKISSKFIVLTNGAKEKGKNALNILGDRCSGILTLGNAKKIFNIENMIPGKELVIYGTENLYTALDELSNPKVTIKAILGENAPSKLTSLAQNIYQGFEITDILGDGRLSKVIISKGNEKIEIPCDTLIIAQGLLSDGIVAMRSNITLNPATTGPKVNENFETSRENIFACGNGIFIHNYIEEIETEAASLMKYISSK